MSKLKKILSVVTEIFIPVGGDIIENIKSRDGGVGRFVTPRFIKAVIRLIVAIVTTILVLKGEVGLEALGGL